MPAHLNEQNIHVEPNNQLSALDKAFMIINYPHFDNVDKGQFDPKRDQFEGALDTVGVAGDRKEKILHLYDAHNWSEVRYEFTRFTTDMHLARKAAMASAYKAPRDVESQEVMPDVCLAEDDEDKHSLPGASKGVATVEAELWLPGDTITYTFIQGRTDATGYRRGKIRDTFDSYSARANLQFVEVPFEPHAPEANMRIFFGDIPKYHVAAWCTIGRSSIGFRQTRERIAVKGGTVESSFVISNVAVPKVAPTEELRVKQATRTLFHEIGHGLGLKHEHVSPYTKTTDKPDTEVSAATIFDDNSVMLYANRELRATPGFQNIEENFRPETTKYNHVPSDLDYAFLGVSHSPHLLFDLVGGHLSCIGSLS